MKTLVTGGAGFIGGYLCEALTSEGHSVIALDNMSNANINYEQGYDINARPLRTVILLVYYAVRDFRVVQEDT
jgi:nucleoside-diphosphate-sugar epimerase